jgi:broad specificity polyphosphatase/5'/3'-nucleotidase SurE
MTKRHRHITQAAPTTPKSPARLAVEGHMINNPGRHTFADIAEATGVGERMVRKLLGQMASAGDVVNVNRGTTGPATYQHKTHWSREQQQTRVTRTDPITNAGMPNGDTAYWRAHMARFNEPPRVTR